MFSKEVQGGGAVSCLSAQPGEGRDVVVEFGPGYEVEGTCIANNDVLGGEVRRGCILLDVTEYIFFEYIKGSF